MQVLVDCVTAVPSRFPHQLGRDVADAGFHVHPCHQHVVVVAAALRSTHLLHRLGPRRLEVVEVPLVVVGRDVAQEYGPTWADLGVVEKKAGQPVADVLDRCSGLVRDAVAELCAAGDHLAVDIEHLRLQNVHVNLLEVNAETAQLLLPLLGSSSEVIVPHVALGPSKPNASSAPKERPLHTCQHTFALREVVHGFPF